MTVRSPGVQVGLASTRSDMKVRRFDNGLASFFQKHFELGWLNLVYAVSSGNAGMALILRSKKSNVKFTARK